LRKAFAVAWLGLGTLFLEPGELGVVPGRPGPWINARAALSAGARFPVSGVAAARRLGGAPWSLEPALMVLAPRSLADGAWTAGGLVRLDVVRGFGLWEARAGLASHVTGWVVGQGGAVVSNVLAPTLGLGRSLDSRVRLDAEFSVVRAFDPLARRGRLYLGVACGL
jgi:hypothetical protein